jgi:peptidoglycan/xylan/chitin deacetylase (PgdA/CDA1 family)
MYHNIVDTNEDLHLYDVSLKSFEEQMGYIHDMYNVIRDTSVILTFDDGYKIWAGEVLNLLKKFNLKAYFFVCIKNLDKGEITKEDILKLKNNGMIIGSHSVTHRFLHLLEESEIYYELYESKKTLEKIIGEEVKYFSVPRGIYNSRMLKIAKEVGYEYLFTSNFGINETEDFLLKRIAIKRNTSLEDFKNIVNGKINKKLIFYQKLKDVAKKSLGINNYNWLRKVLVPRVE